MRWTRAEFTYQHRLALKGARSAWRRGNRRLGAMLFSRACFIRADLQNAIRHGRCA